MAVSEYQFRTRKFERAVIPGSAHPSDEPGCMGTISFQPEPREDLDRDNQLEKWLKQNTALPPQHVEGGTCYSFIDSSVLCSVILSSKTERNNRSDSDPLKYQKTASVKVQPSGILPGDLARVLEEFGYESVR